MAAQALTIGIVAGEASGDRLGGALIEALRARAPDTTFIGMAGPRMIAAGCEELAHVDELSVMGLVEVLRSYPRLRRLRERLVQTFIARRPDVVVGIDVPDFNLGLERRVRDAGIPTVHYVCPQAWAWRAGRAATLSRSCDRLLALLPFEPAFFRERGTATEFVGHPLADTLPLSPDRAAARAALALPADGPLVALLPGSRGQEIRRLGRDFVAAADLVRRHRPEAQAALCFASERNRELFARVCGAVDWPQFVGCSQTLLTASDVAITASGTATLEAFLCATPGVVGYRLAPLSYHIIRRMVTIEHIALPNILTGRKIMPELIQDRMTADGLAEAALAWLDDPERCADYRASSREWHTRMRRDAAARAADCVLELCH